MPKLNEPLFGRVDTGQMAILAQNVGAKLKRRATVTRDRFYYKRHGQMVLSPWKYTVLIEGVNIPFSGLTVNEVKGRLSMLLDLYHHGVFDAANSRAGSGGSEQDAGDPQQGDCGRRQDPVSPDRSDVEHQSPGSDDSY